MPKQAELPFSSSLQAGRDSGCRMSSLLPNPIDRGAAASAPVVAIVLRDYLQMRLGIGDLAFREPPIPYTDGWEAHNYHFHLCSHDPLPPEFAQPLAIRIYCSPVARPRIRREFIIQRHLYQLNYPVAQPLLMEEDCTYLDGPFLIMKRICGPTLLHSLLRRPWRLIHGPVEMAQLHARLHRLPTRGFPDLAGCLLTRRLEEMATAIDEYGLQGLQPGLDWLLLHRPAAPSTARILHLDFHPLNLVVDQNGSLVVLDWNEAEIGDPHADVGTTVMLMDCLPPVRVTSLQRLSILAGQPIFCFQYLRTYRQQMPLDEETLAYYRAFAAFRRLCNYGRWLQDGPQISGNKASMLKCITAGHCGVLERYVRKWSGTDVRL